MLAMVGIGLGGVLNIGLDPLFIYTFGLGIAGAAIATLLSQCVSFAILLACFLRRKSAVRLHIGQVSRKAEVYARIIKTGMPSFCRQSLASVATVSYTHLDVYKRQYYNCIIFQSKRQAIGSFFI